MLERGKEKRFVEKIMKGTAVEDVAKCMIYDAENGGDKDGEYVVYEEKDILNTVKLIGKDVKVVEDDQKEEVNE